MSTVLYVVTIAKTFASKILPTKYADAFFDVALDAPFAIGDWRRTDFARFAANFVKANRPHPAAVDPFREKQFANLDQVTSTATSFGPRVAGAPDHIRFADGKHRCRLLIDLPAVAGQPAAMQSAKPSRHSVGNGPMWGLGEYRRASLNIAYSAGE